MVAIVLFFPALFHTCSEQVMWGEDGEARARNFFSSLFSFFFLAGLVLHPVSSCFTNLSPRSCSSVIPIDYWSGGDARDDGHITG